MSSTRFWKGVALWIGIPAAGITLLVWFGVLPPRLFDGTPSEPPELANVSEQATLPPSQEKPLEFDRTIEETDRRLGRGDEINTGTLLKQGNVLFTTGDYAKAVHYYEVAEDVARQQQDSKTVTLALQNKALMLASLGRYSEALEIIERDSSVIQSMSDSSIIAEYHNNLGVIHFEQGDYRSSETHFRRALEISSISGYIQGQATATGYTGLLQIIRGQPDSGFTALIKAAELSSLIGFERGLSTQYGNLSSRLFQAGQTNLALVYARRALEIAYSIPFRLGIANGEINLAHHFSNTHQFDLALVALDSARSAYILMGHKSGEIDVLDRIARVYLLAGDTGTALTELLEARELSFTQPTTVCSRSHIAFSLGHLSYELGDLEDSKKYFREALTAADSCANRDYQVSAWSGLGLVYRAEKEYDSALTAHANSHNTAVRFQFWSGATKAAYNIGVIYEELRQDSLALVYLGRAYAVAEKYGLVDERRYIQSTISDIHARTSKRD